MLGFVITGWIRSYRIAQQESYLISRYGKLERPKFGVARTALRRHELLRLLADADDPEERKELEQLLAKAR
jgi:hypothetical protein